MIFGKLIYVIYNAYVFAGAEAAERKEEFLGLVIGWELAVILRITNMISHYKSSMIEKDRKMFRIDERLDEDS